jgi:hypothetical protein
MKDFILRWSTDLCLRSAGGDLGWLKATLRFGIAGHGDPAHRPIGNLYVLNDRDWPTWQAPPH